MSVMKNLNYIGKIMHHPCSTPDVETMISTGFQAAIPNLLNLALFGCMDIMKTKIGRAPWHMRGMSAAIKKAAGGKAAGANQFLFLTPYNQIEAAIWHYMVMEAATSFVADWMSLIYEAQRCSEPGAGYLRAGLTSLFLDAGTGYQIFIDTRQEKECCALGGNKITIPAGCHAQISFQADFEPFLGLAQNAGGVTTWLERETDGTAFAVTGGAEGKNGVQHAGGMFTPPRSTIIHDETYILKWSLDRGLMGCTRGSLSVSGYGRHIPLIPAGCKAKSAEMPYPVG